MPKARENRSVNVTAGEKPVIQSAARMVRLIYTLVRSPRGVRLSDLSAGLGLPQVTMLRLVQTLVGEGIAERDPGSGLYRLNSLFWLAMSVALPDARLVQTEIYGALEWLARNSSATALLLIPLRGRRRLSVGAYALPDYPLIAHPPKDAWVHIHATAAGKCYLASLPDDELHRWLKGHLSPVTQHTITSPEVLLKEVQEVRRRGYAMHREEPALGCWGMAVPIVDAAGAVIAGLQLSAPLTLMTAENARRWLPLLQRGATRLSGIIAPGRTRTTERPPDRPTPAPGTRSRAGVR